MDGCGEVKAGLNVLRCCGGWLDRVEKVECGGCKSLMEVVPFETNRRCSCLT
jgi:hypothetical protein